MKHTLIGGIAIGFIAGMMMFAVGGPLHSNTVRAEEVVYINTISVLRS